MPAQKNNVLIMLLECIPPHDNTTGLKTYLNREYIKCCSRNI